MKEIIFWVVVSILAIAAVSAASLMFKRVSQPFQEETRRLTYENSVTAQTSCRRELTRLYREWSAVTGPHKTALEALAIEESDRFRCNQLTPTVQRWIEDISR